MAAKRIKNRKHNQNSVELGAFLAGQTEWARKRLTGLGFNNNVLQRKKLLEMIFKKTKHFQKELSKKALKNHQKRKKILLVFGSGGHAEQAKRLFDDLVSHYDIELLIENSDPVSEKKFPNVKIHKAYAPIPRMIKSPKLSLLIGLIACFFQAFFINLLVRPNAILSPGPGIAFPASFWGKLLGSKVIFIESWSRVTTKSRTGRYMYVIADHFFVQWPEMKKKYPKSIYVGRLG